MATPSSSSQGGVMLPPTPEKIQAKFDVSIALSLASWPALTLAVENHWGGPNSGEKRDWFAGAVSDLLQGTPDADAEYLEEFMLNVLNDEFDVNVEDGSAEEVADNILELRRLTLKGDFKLVDEMMARWQEKQRRGGEKVGMKFVEGDDAEEEVDWDSDGADQVEDDEDVEMDEAPSLVIAPIDKPPLEIDEDGFTKVVGRRRH